MSAFDDLREIGFGEAEAQILADHFEEADRRGRPGHGVARIPWLRRLEIDFAVQPRRLAAEPSFERWDGSGTIGYLTLARIVEAQLAEPPERVRLIVAASCFPTGFLGYWVRALAESGLVAVLTTTSPPRLASPEGGPPLAGTNPLAIGIPSSDGRPLVADVSMGKVTYGDVLTGAADEEELVPFGGEQAHKAFALAVGLHMLVGALAGEDHAAVLLVARPEHDPVPTLRALAGAVRLPGDR